MYNTYTFLKQSVVVAVVAAGFLITSPAMAGKGYGKPGDLTIAETALATPRFSSLVEAIVCFSPDELNPLENNPVIDLLSGNRKFTVFAPNNAAFDKLLNGTDPCDLGLDTLYAVLTYHVTNGRRFDNSVFNVNKPKMIRMISGGTIRTEVDTTPVIEDQSGQLIGLGELVNVKASNGVIHEIDTVMLP